MASAKAYIPRRIFTGEAWLDDHAVITENGIITAVLPVHELAAGADKQYFPGHLLAPAFIDLQIYGAYEKLFSVFRDTASLALLNQYSNKGGAAFCMPTVATNEPEVFYRSVDAIREYWNAGGKGILGLHAEGPWINKTKRGAHIASLIHSPSLKEAADLLQYGKGVIKIITLAPECCSPEIIELILSYDIVISAGHSDISYQDAMQYFDKGITGITHLYNAMSPLQHRSPGLVGAAFNHPAVMASIIADGHHVDYAAIRIAKKMMQQRLFAITDAVTTTTEGYYQHQAADDKYVANNILSGSALTMYKSVQNLVNHAGIELGEALRMCSLYPAQLMKMDGHFGKIAPGYQASLVLVPETPGETAVELVPSTL